MLELQYNEDLIWQSDWNGNEVGYDEVDIVGLYRFKNGDEIYVYIDMESNQILEVFCMCDDQ